MLTIARTDVTSIPLPPSSIDANGRVLLYELTNDERTEGWRVFQLADGSYAFEVHAYDIVLLSEHHTCFADASARVSQWYGEEVIRKAA